MPKTVCRWTRDQFDDYETSCGAVESGHRIDVPDCINCGLPIELVEPADREDMEDEGCDDSVEGRKEWERSR